MQIWYIFKKVTDVQQTHINQYQELTLETNLKDMI